MGEVIRRIMGLEVRISVKRDYISSVHLEYHIENKVPIWFTDTGYRSQFFPMDFEHKDLSDDELVNIGIEWLQKEFKDRPRDQVSLGKWFKPTSI